VRRLLLRTNHFECRRSDSAALAQVLETGDTEGPQVGTFWGHSADRMSQGKRPLRMRAKPEHVEQADQRKANKKVRPALKQTFEHRSMLMQKTCDHNSSIVLLPKFPPGHTCRVNHGASIYAVTILKKRLRANPVKPIKPVPKRAKVCSKHRPPLNSPAKNTNGGRAALSRTEQREVGRDHHNNEHGLYAPGC
jgi:hypothetical protein